MFRLRDYQKECIDSIVSTFKDHQTQLVQLPTGSGKTVILWHYLKRVKCRSIIVAPTRELIEQIYETGCDVVNRDDIYLKKKSHYKKRKHLITTMQGLTWMLKTNRADELDFDTLIIDEAHRSQSPTYREFIDRYIVGTKRKCLGLTATPERLDGKNLLDVFELISFERSFLDLIKEKYLTDIMCFKIKTNTRMVRPSFSGIDFSKTALLELDIPERNGILIDIVLNKCKDKKTIVFCLSVDHSIFISKTLRDKGIKAESIYGRLPMGKRKDILRRFRSGEIEVLTNCQLLTEGFDEPSIQALVLARPTRSKTLYCQMIGRGVRPYKNKDFCYLYDLCDNNFNIVSFNALGNIPNEYIDKNVREGISFTRLFDRYERDFTSIAEVEYKVEIHNIFSKFDDIPVFDHQINLLKNTNIPFQDDITVHEAAFLLWKNRKFKEYGFDSKTVWKNWINI